MLRKIFNMQDYRLTKLWLLTAVVSSFLILSAIKVRTYIDDTMSERSMQKKIENGRQNIQLEVERRRVVREKTNNIANAPDPKSTQITELPQNTSADAVEGVDAMPMELTGADPASRVLTAGPYKGMTTEEVHAYEQRERDWVERVSENNNLRTKVFNLTSQNIENRQSLMISVFKSLSSEQISHLREESFKRIPSEDVEYFFDNLESKGSKMTDAELTAEGQRILASSEAEDAILREVEIVHEELMKEHEELQEYVKQKNIELQ